MILQTKIPLTKAVNQIDYKSRLLLLGSCFSENIGAKLAYFKFRSDQNPFGILFHPLAIENLVSRAVALKNYKEEEVFFENERWHCFDAHSDLSDASKEKLLEKLNDRLAKTNQQIKTTTHVIMTLGTAWVYRNIATNRVVANCHKIPQKQFEKELGTVDEIQKSLENTLEAIRLINDKVQFIFTVSPVRHLKDGFIENQRSKAHLITAIHRVIESSNFAAQSSYFPAYELMMDELREYRFYKADMVHPNQIAVDYIWEKFKKAWVSEAAEATLGSVGEIQKGLAHRPFNPNSEQHLKFIKSLEQKITYLKQEYDFMEF